MVKVHFFYNKSVESFFLKDKSKGEQIPGGCTIRSYFPAVRKRQVSIVIADNSLYLWTHAFYVIRAVFLKHFYALLFIFYSKFNNWGLVKIEFFW